MADKSRIHSLTAYLTRARRDLDRVAAEVEEIVETSSSDDSAEEVNHDLMEVRARVEALEHRVAVIEGAEVDHEHD